MGRENSGRRPKPTALKLLQGNPGKRPINAAEPRLDGPVVKPRMSKAASAAWDELAPVCLAMGTLTASDVVVFRTLCELQATLDMASQQKDAPEFAPFTLSQDFDGAAKVGIHAAVKLEKDYASTIRPYYALFGLEPVARARMSVPQQDDTPQSKWAGVLK